jgi:hypothetical protein
VGEGGKVGRWEGGKVGRWEGGRKEEEKRSWKRTYTAREGEGGKAGRREEGKGGRGKGDCIGRIPMYSLHPIVLSGTYHTIIGFGWE